jgi:hypothetical protein
MNARAKTFGSPSGEPSATRPYASTNVRKTLDTTSKHTAFQYKTKKQID